MQLLERHSELQELERRLHESQAQAGSLVLLMGEAGVGKSALLEQFMGRHVHDTRILRSACSAPSISLRRGGVHEIAAQLRGTQHETSSDIDAREQLFTNLVDALARVEPTPLVVIEDLHWADPATIAFVRHAASRIQHTHCLFVTSYRDDELPATHPVRTAVTEITGRGAVGIRLAPLSLSAVKALARETGRDPSFLYEVTGGNPFLLSEMLTHTDATVPDTVRDAVMARFTRCSAAARQVIELVCVCHGGVELRLVAHILGAQQAGIDEGIDRGLLHRRGSTLAFRHELTRLAVHTSLPQSRARSWLAHIRSSAAPFELERGNWSEAERLAGMLAHSADLPALQRIPALITLALVRARRGNAGVEELLASAFELALRTGELPYMARVAAARAEYAWYRGDLKRVERESAVGLEHARACSNSWIKSELLLWQSRARRSPATSVPGDVAAPYRLMLLGDWRAAASAWEQLGMPYERALALASGPQEALREALVALDRLGAVPLAAIVRRYLREQGARDVPRGPNMTTRCNPAGLTSREIEVLTLLVEGRTNAQLAQRLHLSPKTVDHHVSAILDKLGVHTRGEAIASAFARGIIKGRVK